MKTYTVGSASIITGLSADTLRVWERRYDAVRPERSAGGQRFYTESQLKRLKVLALLVHHGERIGTIASLSDEELEHALSAFESDRPDTSDKAMPYVQEAVSLLPGLDEVALDRTFSMALAETGALDFIDDFVFPFQTAVRVAMSRSLIDPAHMSFARTALRDFLARTAFSMPIKTDAPSLVLSGSGGIEHESGLLGTSIHCSAAGWRPVRFGMDTRVEELAMAARAVHARVVVYAVVFEEEEDESVSSCPSPDSTSNPTFSIPEPHPSTSRRSAKANSVCIPVQTALKLRSILDPEVHLLFGGRLCHEDRTTLTAAGLESIANMDELRKRLCELKG